jgi:hypothetical protein
MGHNCQPHSTRLRARKSHVSDCMRARPPVAPGDFLSQLVSVTWGQPRGISVVVVTSSRNPRWASEIPPPRCAYMIDGLLSLEQLVYAPSPTPNPPTRKPPSCSAKKRKVEHGCRRNYTCVRCRVTM